MKKHKIGHKLVDMKQALDMTTKIHFLMMIPLVTGLKLALE